MQTRNRAERTCRSLSRCDANSRRRKGSNSNICTTPMYHKSRGESAHCRYKPWIAHSPLRTLSAPGWCPTDLTPVLLPTPGKKKATANVARIPGATQANMQSKLPYKCLADTCQAAPARNHSNEPRAPTPRQSDLPSNSNLARQACHGSLAQ